MENYDPSDLVSVCESIVEDGEISGEELYRLAEWLNDHREACLCWPGELLVKPLQEVWADDKVTKTEIRKIGRLLIRIRKDFAKHQVEVAVEQAADYAAEIANSIDLAEPRIPSIPIVFHVKSHTDKSMVYEVDLSGPTCTCPDWRSNRYSLARGHLSRCCKHVFDAYGKVEPEGGWPGWFGAFLDESWAPHPLQEWMVLKLGGRFVLASTAPKAWANAYVEQDGSYDRFGYNLIEDRWAYGMEPPGSDRIRRAIREAAKV